MGPRGGAPLPDALSFEISRRCTCEPYTVQMAESPRSPVRMRTTSSTW